MAFGASSGPEARPSGMRASIASTYSGDSGLTTLPGAHRQNPECANYKPIDNNMEDPMSVGSYITFGRFRTAHLGDLTRNKEFEMMCPITRLPPVDLFVGLHHGVETSNSPVIVHALHPRVAIINNGTRKGGDPTTMTTLASSLSVASHRRISASSRCH